MRTIALVLSVVGIASLAESVPDNLYRNMLVIPGSYFHTLNEYGDKVTLAAGSRNLTSFTFAYYADLTTGENDETVKVRLYDATGSNGGPGNLLWQSGDMPIRDGLWNKTVVIPGGITVPDEIIFTVEFKNMANIAGDRAGLILSNPPSRGSSADNFWMFDTGAWGEYFFGGNPVANFQASFWVDGTAPQPYQNENPNSEYYFPAFFEPGDEIQLEGIKRTITKVRFSIYCPALTNPGDESVRVRIWKLDGPNQTPGTMLWQSDPLPFVADPNNLQIFEVNVPNIQVEDAMVWTLLFAGVTQQPPFNDAAGPIVTGQYNPNTQVRTDFEPQLGSSGDYFVGRNVPSQPEWTYWIFQQPGPQANFEFAMEGTGVVKVQPSAFSVTTGVHTGGNLQSLFAIDNDRLIIRESPPLALGLPSIAVNIDGVSPTANPTAMTIRVVMNTSAVPAGATQFRVLGVRGDNTTEILATAAGTTADQTFTITPTGDLSRFVQTGTNRLRIRLQIFDPGTLFAFGWSGRINFVSWEVE